MKSESELLARFIYTIIKKDVPFNKLIEIVDDAIDGVAVTSDFPGHKLITRYAAAVSAELMSDDRDRDAVVEILGSIMSDGPSFPADIEVLSENAEISIKYGGDKDE